MTISPPPTPPKPLIEIAAGGKLRLNWHAGQWRAWNSPKRFVAVIAGTQSGKTAFGPAWLYREIQRKGPGDYLVVGPTNPLLIKKALPEFLRYFKTYLHLGDYKAQSKIFLFSNGGSERTFGRATADETKVFFGHATDPESLESATAKACWLDEAGQNKFRLDSWEAIQRRLAIHQGRALITTTPYNLGWLKQHIYDPWDSHRRAGIDHPDIDVIGFVSVTNPTFPREEYERAERELPRWKFDLFYRGVFSQPLGLIYDTFITSGPLSHVRPRFVIPEKWPRYVGLDFGSTNTAAIFFAGEMDDQGRLTKRLFAYREHHPGKYTTAWHAQKIREGEPRLPLCVGGSSSEGEWRLDFARAGLPVLEPPIRDVEVGIQAVYGCHVRHEIIVFDDLKKYLEQKATYSREVSDTGQVLETIADKQHYHLCFVAGTMIATPSGQKPIEDIRPGDTVLTRRGPRRVIICGKRANQPLRRVHLSNGRHIIGTPDHPIWIEGRGFVPIDSVSYDDSLFTLDHLQNMSNPCRAGIRRSVEKQSRRLGSHGTDTPTPTISLIEDISSAAGSCFTEEYGNPSTGKFQTVITSTTRTTMPQTMTSATSNCSRREITRACTTKAFVRRPRELTLTVFAPLLLNGTGARRGVNGTKNTQQKQDGEGPERANAINAELPTIWKRSGTTIASAPQGVDQRHGGIAVLITSSGPVPCAGLSSFATVTQRRDAARVSVQQTSDAGRGEVYSLSVEDCHEYFANGVLVSNCDAERYIISHLRHGKKLNLFV